MTARALFNVNTPDPVAGLKTGLPWPMLPVCGRPLIEYWLELAGVLGIRECLIIENGVIEPLESLIGNGSRWGISASFVFPGSAEAEAFCKDSSKHLRLSMKGPIFPLRLSDTIARVGDDFSCSFTDGSSSMDLSSGVTPTAHTFESICLQPVVIRDIAAFYSVSMRLIGGEMRRYVTPGYAVTPDGSYIGMDTLAAASCELRGPLVIGDRCRLGVFTTIGPSAIIGDDVVVDRETEICRSIILNATYIGRNLDIKDKIVSGRRIIDPSDGEMLELSDFWIVGTIQRNTARNIALDLIGRIGALMLLALLFPPFLLVGLPLRLSGCVKKETARGRGREGRECILIRHDGHGLRFRLYAALLCDIFPRLPSVLTGRLFLCGTDCVPADQKMPEDLERQYYPALLTYAGARGFAPARPEIAEIDRGYYAGVRSFTEDLRIFFRFVRFRLLGARS